MNFKLNTSAFAAAMSLSAVLACAPVHAAQVNKAEYNAGKTKISADYKADKDTCDTMSGNAKDVCQEEAKAKEKNARAALEYAYTGKASDQKKMLTVQADTAYDVAKEKCDEQAGNAKDVCVQQAKTVHTKAIAELKLVKAVADAGKDVTDAKRDADLKLANEKCDALAGDAKSSCQSAAQSRYGKR